jgi:hypothetical protein
MNIQMNEPHGIAICDKEGLKNETTYSNGEFQLSLKMSIPA